MLHDTPKTTYLREYHPPVFHIDQVELHFDLDEERTLVRSLLYMRRDADAAGEPLRLHGEQLELLSLKLDEEPLDADAYLQDDESLTIFQLPEQFVLESTVRIFPQNNTALEGLYQSNGMFCTQCEAEGFRRITWYLDRPDVMACFTTFITADRVKYPVLLSNGNPIESKELPDGRHRMCWHDPFPKPCYLFALVAGDLCHIESRYTTGSGREVALQIFVEPENIDRCDHALRSLKRAMAWDEQHYGREYDLDIYMIVAVNDFNMGAMENKGLNIFNAKYVLARADTATDQDFQGIEAVIAHEYFHNWTGNRITCRDWFQLSLKEGLTVFRDQEFSADMGSRGVKRIEDVRLLRAHQFAEDAGPMAHPVRPDAYIEINNFYTVTVYEKGAELVRMQRLLLGSETYRRGMDLYFERHDGQAVTTDDFIQCMEDVSGRDLGQFRNWYSQAGTPELRITGEYDAAQGTFQLDIRQSCPATPGQTQKSPFHIPLAVGLLESSGEELPLQLAGEEETPAAGTRILELRRPQEQFRFIGLKSRPTPSLLRGFSAPVKIRYDYSDDELIFLMAHDSDAFNRWDAAQTLAQRIILNRVQHRTDQLPSGYIAAMQKVLKDATADRALRAEILSLPSESYLGDQMDEVDVTGIHTAREALKKQIAEQLRQDLLACYHRCGETGEYRPTAADMGRRSLKNRCLDYLMQLDDAQLRSLCFQQFQANHNMTDVIAALGLLASHGGPERETALAEFYARWQSDPLVLDKWFAIQATSKRPDTLARVKELRTHPAFSMTNPNRVRSLIGAFCGNNPLHFHAADGSGYAFLADAVLELDRLNPQVASRMLRLMSRWQRYDASRRALMQTQLQRILSTQGLSRDLYEIASKSLSG